MRIRRFYIVTVSLAAALFTAAPKTEAQSPISTSVILTAAPSTVYPGQAVSLTATLTVASGSVGDLQGTAIDFFENPESAYGFSIGYLNNGVATATYYPTVTGTSGGTVTLTATFSGSGNYQPSSASTNVTVQPISSTTLQAGQYIFLLQGLQDTYETPAMAAVGSLALDGNGNVSGEEDLNNTSGVETAIHVTGSYTFSQNGVGTLTLRSSALGEQQFAVFLPSPLYPTTPSQASLLQTYPRAVGKGKLVLQQNGYLPYIGNATYAIDAVGEAIYLSAGHDSGPVFVSGQLVLGSSTIEGTAAETIGTTVVPSTPLTGSFGAPDSQGRFLFTVGASAGFGDEPTHFVGYAINYDSMVFLSLDPHPASILISGTGRGDN